MEKDLLKHTETYDVIREYRLKYDDKTLPYHQADYPSDS